MKMNIRTIFGLAAVAGLLAITAPTGSAQAMSLISPAASSSAKQASDTMTTEVRWRRHHRAHRHHGWRRHHRWHRHHTWRHRHWHRRHWR